VSAGAGCDGAVKDDENASALSEAADSGSGTCEGERSAPWTFRVVTVSDTFSWHGSIVHSQCRLLRFLRNSNVGFKRRCIPLASTMQSLMAAAWTWRSLPAFRFLRRSVDAVPAFTIVHSSMSDSSDDDIESSEGPSESEISSSEDKSECLAVYVIVLIVSSGTSRNVTFFGAGKKALRPARGLSPARHEDGLRRPESTGLFRRILFRPSEIWYGLSSLLEANGERRREEDRANLEPVGEAVAGEKRCGIS
jgi:hypothetical protein